MVHLVAVKVLTIGTVLVVPSCLGLFPSFPIHSANLGPLCLTVHTGCLQKCTWQLYTLRACRDVHGSCTHWLPLQARIVVLYRWLSYFLVFFLSFEIVFLYIAFIVLELTL